MKEYASRIHLVQADHVRAMKIDVLAQHAEDFKFTLTQESAERLFEPIIENGNIAKTMEFALEQSLKAKEPEVVVVLGSFYMMSETRQYLGLNDERDPIYILVSLCKN